MKTCSASEMRMIAYSNMKPEKIQMWVFRKIKRRAKIGLFYAKFDHLNQLTLEKLADGGFVTTKSTMLGCHKVTVSWK